MTNGNTILKHGILLLFLLLGGVGILQAQRVALKSDLLLWATTTPNAGVETALGHHLTLSATVAYNAWKFSGSTRLNLYLAEPELRYWFCRRFEGHFVGVHAHYAHYNIGGLSFISGLKDRLVQGDLYGGGLTYGYHWAIGERWGLEAVIGGGYNRLEYDKYRCAECDERIGTFMQNYFGVTRAGVSLIYFLR